MKKRYNSPDCWETLREKLIGLGEHSIRKSYYPELQQRLIELESIENELRKHRNRLETLVKERTSELKSANEQLKQEIAERKLAEVTLKKSQALYRAIVEDQTELICRFLPEGTLTFVNQAYCRYFGKKHNELIGHSFMQLVIDEDRKKVELQIASMCHKNPVTTSEHRIMMSSNEIRWQQWTNRAILDEQSSIIEIQAVGRDITERKQAEEALRLSEEFFSKAFNSSPIMMSIIRFSDCRYININDTFLHYTGYSRQEVIGCTAFALNIWIDATKETGLMRLLQEQGAVYNKELRLRTKSGDIREVIVSRIIININGEKCILEVAQDITEKKQFEKEITRLERLNLVGQIAAGIGHEIRNPMTTVRGFLQILGGKEKCIEYKKFFNLMIEELDRANLIITEFLSLAKHKALDKKVQNINAVLKTLLPLMQADGINVDKYIDIELGETPDFLMNEKEIRQLVLNLVRNGLEAMPPGGILHIRTFADNDEMVLSVQDQGKGIEPDVIEKIGTPFFTTKDNGTGLGLAVCYSIAARHNAIIKLETGPTGTTFFVRFKI